MGGAAPGRPPAALPRPARPPRPPGRVAPRPAARSGAGQPRRRSPPPPAAPIDPSGRLADELPWTAGRGWFVGFTVTEGTEPIAFLWGHIADATLWVDKMAFDERSRSVGPGSVLFAHTLRRAHDLGARRADLGYGDYPYKRFWSNAAVTTRPVNLLRSAPRTAAAYGPPAAWAGLRTSAIAALTAAGAEERLRRLSNRTLGR